MAEKVEINSFSGCERINFIVDFVSRLMVLYDKGGVLLNDYYCLTESLEWIKGIESEIHLKRGLDSVPAQVFGFYSPEMGSANEKVNIRTRYEVEKYVRLFPSIQPYFLVAKSKSPFIEHVIREIISIFTELTPQSLDF